MSRLAIGFLLGFLLTAWIAPVFSQVSAVNPTAQAQVDATQLMREGEKYYQAEQFSEAVKKFTQAAEVFETQNKERQQAIALSNLSQTYLQLRQRNEGQKAVTKSLQLLGFNPDCQGMATQPIPDISPEKLRIVASALDIYGHLLYTQGQPSCALSSWRLAGALFAQQNNLGRAIGSQINQAQSLQALGLYQDAKGIFETVERNLELIESPKVKIKALLSFGNVLRAIGDLKTSQEKLEEGLRLAEGLESRQDISAALLSLGNTFQALGNLVRDRQAPIKYEYQYLPTYQQNGTGDESQDYYQKAEEKYQCAIINETRQTLWERDCTASQGLKEDYQQALRDSSLASVTALKAQLNLLSLFLETSQWTAAQELSAAIKLSNLPVNRTKIYAEINLAKNLAYLQVVKDWLSWDDIIKRFQTAAQEASDLGDSRAQSYALGNLGGLYEYLGQHQPKTAPSDWRQTAQKQTQDALYLAQPNEAPDIAYRWQWQLGRLWQAQGETEKAIAAYEDAVKTLAAVRGDLLAINADVQFSFRDTVEPIYRELVSLLLSPPYQPKKVPSQENLWKSLYYLESLQLAELENFLQCNLQTVETPKRNRTPTPEEATAALKKRIDQVLQADPTTALIYPLLLKERVAVILKLPGQALRYYPTPISQNQLEKVLEQLPKKLRFAGGKREVQQYAQEVYQWLIEPLKADLDSSQSKTLVFSLDTPLRNIPMAVLYDGKEYLIEKYAVAAISGLELLQPQVLPREPLKALLAGLTEANQGYPPLKNVEGQFKKIESEVSSQVILNQAFTVTDFRKQIESFSFPVIHIATHGEFSSQPEETFIITWNDRLDANALGNLLKSRERERAKPIELLVLAACETAEGDKWATLGLAGVAVKSGTSSTLATLWKISADESPGDLLSQFYQKLIDNPDLNKAEALQLAQREFLRDNNRQAPYYWAAYVLIGNWL